MTYTRIAYIINIESERDRKEGNKMTKEMTTEEILKIGREYGFYNLADAKEFVESREEDNEDERYQEALDLYYL